MKYLIQQKAKIMKAKIKIEALEEDTFYILKQNINNAVKESIERKWGSIVKSLIEQDIEVSLLRTYFGEKERFKLAICLKDTDADQPYAIFRLSDLFKESEEWYEFDAECDKGESRENQTSLREIDGTIEELEDAIKRLKQFRIDIKSKYKLAD